MELTLEYEPTPAAIRRALPWNSVSGTQQIGTSTGVLRSLPSAGELRRGSGRAGTGLREHREPTNSAEEV